LLDIKQISKDLFLLGFLWLVDVLAMILLELLNCNYLDRLL